MKQLTIFTPTYNRAYVLHKLYKSLIRQTSQNFVWLIVDDGSTDNTEDIVKDWISENKIEIRYHKQVNGGKMRAHNYGVKHTKTELFVCVDSDDFLTDVAVEHILRFWNKNKNNYDNLCGMVGYRCFVKEETDNPTIKCKFPHFNPDALRNFYKQGFKGDTTLVYRTEVLTQYSLIEIEGEKFVTEGYLYSQIDATYKLIPCDEAFIVCQYMEDGYTNNAKQLLLKNPKGWAAYYNLQCKLWKNSETFKIKLRNLTYYIIMSQIAGNKHIYRESEDKSYRYVLACCLAPYYKYKLLSKSSKIF